MSKLASTYSAPAGIFHQHCRKLRRRRPPNADIKFLSIVGGANGFTVDDLTYAGATAPPPPNAVPEPSVLPVFGLGLVGLMGLRRRMDR
jgi:PEP-CTERM motif